MARRRLKSTAGNLRGWLVHRLLRLLTLHLRADDWAARCVPLLPLFDLESPLKNQSLRDSPSPWLEDLVEQQCG